MCGSRRPCLLSCGVRDEEYRARVIVSKPIFDQHITQAVQRHGVYRVT